MAVFDILERATTSPATFLSISAAVLFAVYVTLHTYWRRLPSNAPPVVSGNFPLTGVIGFWRKRWDFLRQSIQHSPTGNFSFHAGPNTIIALSGEKGRKLFFESKDFSFSKGYAVLFGSAPRVEGHDDGVGREDELSNHFHKRLIHLLKNEQFKKKLPVLKSDVQEAIEAIRREPNGVTDPFESIYRVVFRLTIRMVGADEVADDAVLREQTMKYFEMIDQSATAGSVMFPTLPTPARLQRTYAGARLYMQVEKILKARAESGEKRDDALQHMLDNGDRTYKIIEFIVGALFAGLLNSGINAAWVLYYLATSSEWMAKAREEVQTAAAKYASNPNAPLRHQLDDVPLEAWESEFPVIDVCLKDSIRLTLLGSAFRKNVSGKYIPTGNGNEAIPPNAFITYPIGDVHLNPEFYPEPDKWDPHRYDPDRAEDKKVPYGWLGWGVGRHPCLGMRFAKLEQNIITAYFLAAFDFDLRDAAGNLVTEPPKVDLNGHSAHKPKVRCYLKTTPREK